VPSSWNSGGIWSAYLTDNCTKVSLNIFLTAGLITVKLATMLLSSVNFVAKPKIGKSTKNKEEKRDERKKVAKEETRTAAVCEECLREIEEENTIFKFPTSSLGSNDSFKTSGYISVGSLDDNNLSPIGDRVTIATGDDLCLTVDQFYYTIGLRDESRSDSTCVFRKRILDSKPVTNGQVDTAVFVLDCDQDFYLTTAKDKSLELNYYSRSPSLESPDERFFQVFHTSVGQTLIQPQLHKNFYLHHIDASLSVQQLDLNWRCPEEYFFHFNAVPEPIRPRSRASQKVCTHKKQDNDNTVEKSAPTECTKPTAKQVEDFILDRYVIELPTRKISKNKGFFSDLFMGCFSARSQALTQNSV